MVVHEAMMGAEIDFLDEPYKPYHGAWTARRDANPTKGIDATKGGVFLPDQAKEKPSAGIVVAAGEGKSHPDTGVVIPNPVGEGDRVLYGKFDGTSVKYNGEDHQLIKDDGTVSASRAVPSTRLQE